MPPMVSRRRAVLLSLILSVLLLLGRLISGKKSQIRGLSGKVDQPFVVGCVEPDVSAPRANASFVMLARNSDLHGVLQSISSLERHFNRWFHYPYTVLNDEPFTEEFKEKVEFYASSPVYFGVIPKEDWQFRPGTDEFEVGKHLIHQGDQSIKYGGLRSYHHMCRYFSGKFFDHPLVSQYEWYWRVEPDIEFFCDITYDVFVEMQKNNKVYGYNAFIGELGDTVPNLFRQTMRFKRKHAKVIKNTKLWDSIADCALSTGVNQKLENGKLGIMDGCTFNLCHFWSNFEISRVDFWQQPLYREYFEFLDNLGGFWRERWGDAPVHSLAVAMLLQPEQVHYFRDVGYTHTNIGHCPGNAPGRQIPASRYLPYNRRHDRIWASPDSEVVNGVGCRCRCPKDSSETEQHFCFRKHLVPVFGGFSKYNNYTIEFT